MLRYTLSLTEGVLWFFLIIPFSKFWALPVAIAITLTSMKVLDIESPDDDQPWIKNRAEAALWLTPIATAIMTVCIACWLGMSLLNSLTLTTVTVLSSIAIAAVIVFRSEQYRKPPEDRRKMSPPNNREI